MQNIISFPIDHADTAETFQKRVSIQNLLKYINLSAGRQSPCDLAILINRSSVHNHILLRQLSLKLRGNASLPFHGPFQNLSGFRLNIGKGLILCHLMIQSGRRNIFRGVHVDHREKIVLVIGLIQKLWKLFILHERRAAHNTGKRIQDLIVRVHFLIYFISVFFCPGIQILLHCVIYHAGQECRKQNSPCNHQHADTQDHPDCSVKLSAHSFFLHHITLTSDRL